MTDHLPSTTPVVQEEARAMATGAKPTGVGLCLSGGGYRAMLFHLGGIIRLNQLGMLRTLARVSSVSGGSITAGVLGLRWSSLAWDASGSATNLDELVITPVMKFSERSIDVRSFIAGILTPGRSVSDFVAGQYDKHLFHGATLQDLPAEGQGPRFVINATNVQTGKLLRFSRPYMADYTIGMWRAPTTRLADAVAASSSFPPVLSPHRIKPSGTFVPNDPPGPNGDEFGKELVLTDGGVYDNLGLQTAWARCETLLVSDGGGTFDAQVEQPGDWARHSIRITGVIDSQVRALRKRQLIDSYLDHARKGTYWSIASDIADYQLADALTFVHEPAGYPANVATRLTGLDGKTQRDIVRWGYIICDTALRKWVQPGATKPTPNDIPA